MIVLFYSKHNVLLLFKGTSWLFNAIRLLLVHQDSPFGPADSYRLNHITKNDLETRLIEACGRPLVVRTMRIPDTDWAEDLDQSGHGYMVFVSHRDLRDVIDDCLAIGRINNFSKTSYFKQNDFFLII